jgi:hypothetical protein
MAMTTATLPVKDDALTVCAISALAAMLADVLHEGVGHALLAVLTGAKSGVLSTVAWSTTFDSHLVAAGGTLVNLAAGLFLWLALRRAANASAATRFFLLISGAFNLFDGTGYFLFSGVTDFGDWAQVIAGLRPHWLWRILLFVIGVATYYGAVLVLGTGFARNLGIPANDARLRKLTILPYVSAIVLIGVSGLFNPIGIQLVWQSALPATAGAHSGFLWFRYYMPKKIVPGRPLDGIGRSFAWISVAAILTLVFVIELGRGIKITLRP